MPNDKKESGVPVKIVGTIAAGIGTIVAAVLTAQNAPWWITKIEGMFAGSSKSANLEQSAKTPQTPQTSTPPVVSTSPSTPSSELTSTPPVKSTSPPPTSLVERDDKINKIFSGKTLQKVPDGIVAWELKSCVREQLKVSCFFLLSSSEDGGYGILGSRMVDSEGTAYSPPSLIQFGTGSSTNGDRVNIDMAKGARYKVIIEFSDVPTSISQAVLLQLLPSGGSYSGAKFRNVPIVSIEQ
jgi:hypothetical protein